MFTNLSIKICAFQVTVCDELGVCGGLDVGEGPGVRRGRDGTELRVSVAVGDWAEVLLRELHEVRVLGGRHHQ